ASERCHQEKRKTINGEDILFAMQTLGFDNYVEPLKLYLQKYRESIKGEKSTLPTTTEGREDMDEDDHSLPQFQVGKRFRVRFQALFTRKYWNRYYEFVTTDKQRTARTASAFSYGIFEGNGTLGNAKYQPIAIKFSGPKDNDKLLRYHAACPKYGKEIEDGTGLDELKKFGVGTEMKRVISNIEERLQLQGKINLTAEDAKDLFMLCAFATLNHETREWCSLFTDNDIKVFEYQSDLDNYYTHSYGNEFSYNTSCPLLGDVINTLNKFVKESVPYGIFRFAHSSTMVALQSILGMYKDPYKLMADNFEQSTKPYVSHLQERPHGCQPRICIVSLW
ncbi:hypothetical protein QZH41_006198, partial [Actinostola sp. cb2023]